MNVLSITWLIILLIDLLLSFCWIYLFQHRISCKSGYRNEDGHIWRVNGIKLLLFSTLKNSGVSQCADVCETCNKVREYTPQCVDLHRKTTGVCVFRLAKYGKDKPASKSPNPDTNRSTSTAHDIWKSIERNDLTYWFTVFVSDWWIDRSRMQSGRTCWKVLMSGVTWALDAGSRATTRTPCTPSTRERANASPATAPWETHETTGTHTKPPRNMWHCRHRTIKRHASQCLCCFVVVWVFV